MTGLLLLPAVLVLGAVAVSAAYHAARCGWIYLNVLAEVLANPNPATAKATEDARKNRPDRAEPAHRTYLFGPAQEDLGLALGKLRTGLETEFRIASAAIWARWWTAGNGRRVVCLVRIYGLVLGTLIGTLAVAVITAVQLFFAAVLAVAALAGILTLRVLDGLWTRSRGIRMTCPGCYRRIDYPAYRCPGCGRLHRDVRPGRYGVLRRRCLCDQQELPTLLMFGSHRLAAFCPDPGCGIALADSSGTSAELLLPIVGGQNVGKTRLLTVIVKVLQDCAAEDGSALEFADRTSDHRIRQLQPAVLAGEATRPTPPEQPRAYSMYLTRQRPRTRPGTRTRTGVAPRFPRSRRLLHLYDTAGEKFYESDVLQQLRYLGPSRTFVFVIDPLSIDQVWSGLDSATQDRLRAVSARRSPEFVFQQVLDNLERMDVDPRRARLAVVVSKADLLAAAGVAAPGPGSAAVEAWLDEVGLDNLVRTVRHAFGTVRFFHTSAMLAEDGTAAGVRDLVDWLLARP